MDYMICSCGKADSRFDNECTDCGDLFTPSAMIAKVENTKTDTFQDQDTPETALKEWENGIK
jgi:hypothetical protein